MIYQTPWGDWAFAAAGIISDGYVSKPEAIRARDARIDLLDSDQKRYHAAWMAAEEDKEEQAARIKELEAEVEANQIMLRQFQVHEDQTHAAMEGLLGNSDNFIELAREMKEEVGRLGARWR